MPCLDVVIITFLSRNIICSFLFWPKSALEYWPSAPGHLIILLKSNKFNMAAVSVERSTGNTIFTPPTGEGNAFLRGHPSHRPRCMQREYLHFSVIFWPWVFVWPRESNPRPSALQSTALPTELILPRLLFTVSYISGRCVKTWLMALMVFLYQCRNPRRNIKHGCKIKRNILLLLSLVLYILKHVKGQQLI